MKRFLGLVTLAAVAANSAHADFGIGDLAVLRVGDGTQTLGSTGNSIFIDDYTTGGSFVQSFGIASSGASSLIVSGSATSEGALTLSPDGTTLGFAGYNTSQPYTSSLPGSTSAAVARGFGTMNAAGVYTLQGTTTQFSANNIRTAVTDGHNNYWLGGANSGTYYPGFSTSAGTVQSANANTRVLSIQNGNLYYSTGSGTRGIYGFTGTPTAAASPTLIIGTGAASSPYAFAFNSAGTTAYVADDSLTTAGGGVEKWTLSGGTWSLSYTLKPESSGTAGARSLVVDFSGANPIIYGTTAETSGNQLFSITDTGASSTATDYGALPSNEAFRGITSAPQIVPEPGTMGLMGLGAAMMTFALRRKKK